MMYKTAIWVGVAFGITTGVLVAIQEFFHMPSVAYIGYFLIPFAIGFTFLKVSQHGTSMISRLVVGFVTYGIIVSTMEVLVYKPWHTLLTPYGSKYTEYGLSAFYPFPGVILLVVAATLSAVIWSYSGKNKAKHPQVGTVK